MKKINYLLLLLFALIAVSCEQEYKKEYNWAYPLAGDWMITEYANGVAVSDPFEIKVYNSSFGQDSIWIDDYGKGISKLADYGNYWTMKFKAKADMTSRTFQTNLSMSVVPDYNIGIKVLNGKVINNDSIYFEIKFEDDSPAYGATHVLAGHRSTSYEEYMNH